MKEKTGLDTFLASHREKEKASFHMPGHKGSSFFARLGYGDLTADYDITEIPGADDLRHAESVIREISDRYSELYGSRRSFISVNGSSALIMAAIMSQVKRGHRIIAASDSHISVRNGIELAGAVPVYADPMTLEEDRTDEAFAAPCQIYNGEKPGIPGGLKSGIVADLMDSNDDVDAVILPSPNYFGIVSDIGKIADEVHKRNGVLIVDQAHGAHLKMFRDAGLDVLPVPAEECGADIVIDSTHKTLASFTQSAVVNIFGERVDPDSYEQALLVLESTSPSYLLMDSLAVNSEIVKEHGEELAKAWADDLRYFYGEVKSIEGIRVLTRDHMIGADFDSSKILIDFSGLGMNGEQAEDELIERGVYPEFNTGSIVMCLTGIGNVREDYIALLDALRDISEGHLVWKQ